MKRMLLLLLCFLLIGCARQQTISPEPTESPVVTEAMAEVAVPPAPDLPADPVQRLLEEMTIEEMVGQLFLARCDKTVAEDHVAQYHLGGLVLFAVDFEDRAPDSFRETLSGYQNSAKIPLLVAVDEEGGDVTRISRFKAFRDSRIPSARASYDKGGLSQAIRNEDEKCRLLSSLGINVNLGPLCDITTDPNAFMYRRSLGQSPEITAQYVEETVLLMSTYPIGSVLKHFPGYGNNVDTHTGVAVDHRSLGALEARDLIPFQAGMDAGCGGIMVSHTIVAALDQEHPASLSPAAIGYIRENMGFSGCIMTDDLSMEAITSLYGAGEAAVLALEAGNDILLSTDYITQYNAVLEAVLSGRIDYFRLRESVGRVLRWKQQLGLI